MTEQDELDNIYGTRIYAMIHEGRMQPFQAYAQLGWELMNQGFKHRRKDEAQKLDAHSQMAFRVARVLRKQAGIG